MSRCVGLSCALSVLPTFCFLLFRNNRVILQKSFFKLPNLQAEETSGIFLPRPKHLSATHGRKSAKKFRPAWSYAEVFWNFVFLLLTSVILYLLVPFLVFAEPRSPKKHMVENFEQKIFSFCARNVFSAETIWNCVKNRENISTFASKGKILTPSTVCCNK